jgi:hypothetical protein
MVVRRDFNFDIATEKEIGYREGDCHAQALQDCQDKAREAEKDTVHSGFPPFESVLTKCGFFTVCSFDRVLLF